MLKLDARGLSCPQPVLIVKKGIEGKSPELEVAVDNMTARNNVTRFLKSNGYKNISYRSVDEDMFILAKK
ncbi:MAG: sulfurtransferase TusA family protein [Firmicutes bacterium]|jgi:TusA-related sulfurtransferase|nr:sulfurtransferase TusA family protein [Bacillota bacterium]